MVNTNERILAAIAAVINGTASEEERFWVDRWLLEDKRNQAVFMNLHEFGYTGQLDRAYQVKEKIFVKVQEKTREYLLRRKIRVWQYVSAACIVACMFIGGIGYLTREDTDVMSYVETRCLYGTKSRVVLSDGSVVELNAGSVLRYPATFSGKERNVRLTGEGYFDISKDKEKPFIVTTGDVHVKVLGTVFNLKAYEEDSKVVVTLLEGSVCFENGNGREKAGPTKLIPDQQLIFDKSDESIDLHNVKASLFATWRTGAYYFENETFTEIAHKLERGFNVKIEIKSDPLGQELFSGIFDKGESIQQILDLFKEHRDFDYKQQGGIIEIFEK